jgi:hypothetical protein
MRQNQSIIKYDACDHPFADAAEAIGRNKPEPSIGYFIGWRRSQTGKLKRVCNKSTSHFSSSLTAI